MSLALDTANVFRCGASVAPVTDWTLYDTIYTERYMGLLRDNADGYRNGSLLEHAEALRNKRFYLVHGTADDNVHFQQSMELAMRLERADIEFEQMVGGSNEERRLKMEFLNGMSFHLLSVSELSERGSFVAQRAAVFLHQADAFLRSMLPKSD